jgi:hypothetical protein
MLRGMGNSSLLDQASLSSNPDSPQKSYVCYTTWGSCQHILACQNIGCILILHYDDLLTLISSFSNCRPRRDLSPVGSWISRSCLACKEKTDRGCFKMSSSMYRRDSTETKEKDSYVVFTSQGEFILHDLTEMYTG